MALITTTIELAPRTWAFATPGGRTGGISPSPLARIIFTDDTTVAALLAANESLVIITATLPVNYFYRIADFRIACFSTLDADFDDWENGMAVEISENGVETYHFALQNQFSTLGAAPENSFLVNQGVTNLSGTYFSPIDEPSQYLVDARNGTSEIVTRWVDASADSTAATRVFTRLEVDQFTPIQATAAPVNSSLLTYR